MGDSHVFAALIAVAGVLPSALLGGTVGAIVGHWLCRLPVGATTGQAAAVGATVTGAGVLVLHGCWLVAGGAITLAGGIAENAYLFYLGYPSGMAVLLGALGAAGLYHHMDRDERTDP